MNKLIARLLARVENPLRAVDSAAWVVPMPRVAPPATEAEIDAAEMELGFPIPNLLREAFMKVGNGGFGPHYGLEGVPTIPPNALTSDIVKLYQRYSCEPSPESAPHVWPCGLVPIVSAGCLKIECADFSRTPHAVYLYDGNDCDLQRPAFESMRRICASIEKRLELWLADEMIT